MEKLQIRQTLEFIAIINSSIYKHLDSLKREVMKLNEDSNHDYIWHARNNRLEGEIRGCHQVISFINKKRTEMEQNINWSDLVEDLYLKTNHDLRMVLEKKEELIEKLTDKLDKIINIAEY